MQLKSLFSLFAVSSFAAFAIAACAAPTDEQVGEEPAASQADELQASIVACTKDADCLAVPKGGCCQNGWLEAVNKNKVEQYKHATRCTANPHPMCPMFMVHDTRVAECNK